MTQEVTCRQDRSLHDNASRTTVDGVMLIRHTRYIRSVLFKKGVRRRDLADMTQQVFLSAWRAMAEGRFCPSPDRDPAEALRYWLFGIAWREASDYRGLHSFGAEVLQSVPIEEVEDTAPDDQLDARKILALFHRVPRDGREIMVRVARGEELKVVARQLKITPEAASARLRRGREAFTQIIARWQNHPRRRTLVNGQQDPEKFDSPHREVDGGPGAPTLRTGARPSVHVWLSKASQMLVPVSQERMSASRRSDADTAGHRAAGPDG